MLTPSEHYKRATNLVVAAADFEHEGNSRRAAMVARAQVHALLAQCGDPAVTRATSAISLYPETVTREPTGGHL